MSELANTLQGLSPDAAKKATEVIAKIHIARSVPRDLIAVEHGVIQACQNPTLAEEAVYAFPRGGTTVTGPSIRLMEAIACLYGNIESGFTEVEKGRDFTKVRAYAWDLQNNVIQETEFTVPHTRETKGGGKKPVTSDRDIREVVSSFASRSRRTCLKAVLPGHLITAALQTVDRTLQKAAGGKSLPDQIKDMMGAFKSLHVTQAQIEARIGHKIGATSPPELINLRRIYKTIKDGYAKVGEFFPTQRVTEGDSLEKEFGEEKEGAS